MKAARYIAIEGPLRVGKTSLARALAERLRATTIFDTEDNPYLADFYSGSPGAAFRSQMHFLFARYWQLREAGLDRSHLPVVADYLFEKDKLFAYLNLTDQEVAIYDSYYQHFKEQVPAPDLVVYLKASPDVLRERIQRKNVPSEANISADYVHELARAYEHFFAHYTAADVLVVDTSKVDFVRRSTDLDELLQELSQPVQGTQYFLPLGS